MSAWRSTVYPSAISLPGKSTEQIGLREALQMITHNKFGVNNIKEEF